MGVGLMRLTEKNEFFKYALPCCNVNCDDVSIDNLDILYELFANEKVEVL